MALARFAIQAQEGGPGSMTKSELVAKLPFEISERIAEEVNKVGEDPTVTPDTPAS